MRKLSLLICVLVILVAGSAKAVTVFETFDSDPTTGSWTAVGDAYNHYNYQATSRMAGSTSGWLQIENNACAKSSYTYDISSLGVTTADEFWVEFDLHVSDLNLKDGSRCMGGVFGTDSGSTGTYGPKYNNAVTTYFGQGKPTTWDRNSMFANYMDSASGRIQADAEDSAGSNMLPWGPYTTWNQLYLRTRLHSTGDLGDGTANVDLYLYDLLTGTLLAKTQWNDDDAQVVAPAEAGVNAMALTSFGLTNIWGNSATTTYTQIWEVDNLYFSTDGANDGGYLQADFASVKTIPEPATICLLGLGGLLLRRKKA